MADKDIDIEKLWSQVEELRRRTNRLETDMKAAFRAVNKILNRLPRHK